MVRSLVCALVVQCAAAEDSLMQFEKTSDLDLMHMRGASQTNHMKSNAQEWEDQWKSLLQQVVDSKSWTDPATGKPWVPEEKYLKPIEDAVKEMEDGLEGQKKLNTDIMGNHSESISTCNSNRDTALGPLDGSSGVRSKLKKALASEESHSDCRSKEDSAISTMETTCDTFNATKKCDYEQGWFAGIRKGDIGSGTLNEVVKQAVICKDDIANTTTIAKQCDGLQTSYTTDWCDYKTDLDTACDNHEDCYTLAVSNYKKANSSILVLEEEQKTIFRMLARIRCYLALLVKKEEDGKAYVPTQTDINGCSDTGITADKYTHLDVDYHSVAAKGECYGAAGVVDEPVTDAPGSAAWYDDKFDETMKEHGKLKPNTQGC